MIQSLIAFLSAITLRDASVWAWRKWRRKRKTAENLAGLHRFLDRQHGQYQRRLDELAAHTCSYCGQKGHEQSKSRSSCNEWVCDELARSSRAAK